MTESLFVVGYVEQRSIEEWFANAPVGDQVFYAFGPSGVPENPVQKLVNGWEQAGEVMFLPNVKFGPGRWGYRVRRISAKSRRAPAPKSRRRWPENAAERALLDYIEGLAADGLPLPVNAAIADVLGCDCRDLQDKDQVRYRLRQLQAAGFVQVADVEGQGLTPGAARARRATICDTGAQTAGLVGAGSGRQRVA
jgi:hypothetical protein